MKRYFLLVLFTFVSLSLSALDLRDIQVVETDEEIQINKNKFLEIEISDLIRYEKISRAIGREILIKGKASADNIKLQAEFDSYLFSRLNMICKVFVVFREESSRILDFLDKCKKERLPAFENLIKTLSEAIDAAWLKGSKEKWKALGDRAKSLLLLAQDKDLKQKYDDQIVITADDVSEDVFLAKVSLLHRWLLAGRLPECKAWIDSLTKNHAEKAESLALLSHYTLEQYKLKKNNPDLQKIQEKDLNAKFGHGAVKMKGNQEDLLQKAYLYYVEALKKGYPQEKEIPGLLPEVWARVLGIYKNIYPSWNFPNKYPNYRETMKEMANFCRSIIVEVPFKKYAQPAYKLISDIYRYWPAEAGPNILDYQELLKLNRTAGNKKL